MTQIASSGVWASPGPVTTTAHKAEKGDLLSASVNKMDGLPTFRVRQKPQCSGTPGPASFKLVFALGTSVFSGLCVRLSHTLALLGLQLLGLPQPRPLHEPPHWVNLQTSWFCLLQGATGPEGETGSLPSLTRSQCSRGTSMRVFIGQVRTGHRFMCRAQRLAHL